MNNCTYISAIYILYYINRKYTYCVANINIQNGLIYNGNFKENIDILERDTHNTCRETGGK